MTTPGLITLAIFTFMGAYQSFFWPLVIVKDDHLRNLPLGLLEFQSQYASQTNVLMAAAVVTMIPMLILFIVGQKFFTSGIRLGAVKG
jgi:ABC-type glycerol-3-phosphate transport system permease component